VYQFLDIQLFTSRRMSWIGHVEHARERWKNRRKRDHLEDQVIDEKKVLKLILNRLGNCGQG
jgi:hypothetical protein